MRYIFLREECRAATSSSLAEIEKLHDSIPIPHALVFQPTVDDSEPPMELPPKFRPSAALPPGDGEALPPFDANPPAQASGCPDSTTTATTLAGFAAAIVAFMLAT